MKKQIALGLVVFAILAAALTAYADKPTHPPQEPGGPAIPFGNGAPSGPHFNLNIIAKRPNFTCPCPEYVDGQRVLGNVVFIPREQNDDPITILMESGKKGPKHHPDVTALQVTNWCSESFADCDPETDPDPNTDYDSGVVELPKHEEGYAVYARITGKSGEEGGPTVTISPTLFYVEDEAGHDLILLGLVDGSGAFVWNGTDLVRTDATKKGRGVQKFKEVTNLFLWSGQVCYVNDIDLYCSDGTCTEGPVLCCLEVVDADGNVIYTDCQDNAVCVDGDCTCEEGYVDVQAWCHMYSETWVFNIADFVGYLWHLTSDGAYVIQVRFYPL